MNPEWVLVGIILLGGMAAGGVSLRLKRRKEAQVQDSSGDIHDPAVLDEDKKDLAQNQQDDQ